MPNYCENTICIEGPTSKIKEIYEQHKKTKTFLAILYPPPENMIRGNLSSEMEKVSRETGVPNWYDWQSENWGTKWDIGDDELIFEEDDAFENWSRIRGHFLTAWSPPIKAYDEFLKNNKDCCLEAKYFEPGMSFAGEYNSGDDECYDYGCGTKGEIAEFGMPQDLIDEFGILDYYDSSSEEEELPDLLSSDEE